MMHSNLGQYVSQSSVINFISTSANKFDQLAWLSSYFSSKNRMYPLSTDVLFKNKAPKRIPRIPINFLKLNCWLILELSKQVYGKFLFRSKINIAKSINKNDKPIVIRSFAYKSSITSEGFTDPFFKDLTPVFKNKNKKTIFVVDSLIKWKDLCKVQELVIPYQLFYGPISILKAYLHLLKVFFLFPTKEISDYRNSGEKEKALTELFYIELFCPQTLINLLHYFAGRGVGRTFSNARSFLYTYENNCWERTYTKGIKETFPESVVYAFQHAVMPQASVNMYVGKEELKIVDYTDIIFTTGKYPASLLKSLSSVPTEKVKTLGTTRFNYLHDLNRNESDISTYEVLIALEGVQQASEVLERFYSSCQKENFFPKTLLRLHPAFGIEKMSDYLSFDIDKVSFIEISRSPSVIEDIRKSSAVIYWGSTCSLEALRLGKPIIHCKIPSHLDYDPAGDLTDNRYVWREEDSLSSIIKNITSNGLDISVQEKGIKFVNEYFEKLNLKVVDNYF